MSAATALVTLIARTLPAAIRARYREEWLADLEGSAELGLARSSVVGGALATAATIDRGDPEVSGMPRRALAARRARWAVGLLSSAVTLGASLFLWGGFRGSETGMAGGEMLAVAGSALQVLVVVLIVGGVVMAVAAGVLGSAAYGPRLIVALGIGVPIWIVTLVVSVLIMPLLGLLGVVISAVVLLTVTAGAPGVPAPSAPLTASRRLARALPWSALTLITVALGVLHITVWNPLARVPGLTLDQIYAGMAAANEGTGAAFIAAWAVLWSSAAIALPVLCSIPALARLLPARRIHVLGLLMIGLAVFFEFFASFGMGMGLADTFMTSGGDAAFTGPLLGIIGTLALAGALLLGLAPGRPVPAPA